MDDLTFALSIVHCPWIPARAHSMQLLRAALLDKEGSSVAYREETDRAPWWVWSDQQWRWGAEQNATHVVFTQDDAIAMPEHFWPVLRAMVAARPKEVISLHCLHPASMTLARQGVRWASTADGLVGLGYVFPRALLREYRQWRIDNLRAGGAQELAEDSHINVWAVSTGRRILHPIPTIIDHETRIASTNPGQTAGRPRVVWTDGDVGGWEPGDLERPDFWAGKAVHLGRQYAKTHWAAKMVVPSFDRFFEAESDVCPPEYSRFFRCE